MNKNSEQEDEGNIFFFNSNPSIFKPFSLYVHYTLQMTIRKASERSESNQLDKLHLIKHICCD